MPSERKRPHRVLLVDDSEPMRAYVREVLTVLEEVEVIGEATDGWEAVQMVEADPPDIVMMDIAMPIMNGLEASAAIKERFPGVHILMLSLHHDPEYIARARELGVEGFLSKDDSSERLIRGLLAVAQGGTLWGSDSTDKN